MAAIPTPTPTSCLSAVSSSSFLRSHNSIMIITMTSQIETKSGDDGLDTPEMVRAKLSKDKFVNSLDAFDNFLEHMVPRETDKSYTAASIRAGSAAAKPLNFDDNDKDDDDDDDDDNDENDKNKDNDDNSNGLLSDSDDEFASPSYRREPHRGVRKNHSGVLEQIFQKELDAAPENELTSPTKKAPKQSPSLARKCTARGSGLSRTSEHSRREKLGRRERGENHMSTSEHDRSRIPAEDLIKGNLIRRGDSGNMSGRGGHSDSHHGGRHQSHLVTENQTSAADGSIPSGGSLLQGKLRRQRDESWQSEHVRPHMRRDELYSTSKRQTNSGSDLAGRRTSSDLDFQLAAAAAARRHQGAGGVISNRRFRTSTVISPVRTETVGFSSSAGLRRTSGHRNSSSELSQQSARLRRSQTCTGSIQRTSGSRNSANSLSLLEGIYSPFRTDPSARRTMAQIGTDDARKVVKRNAGNTDIDDLVLNMKRITKTNMLQKMHSNATWNLMED